jgi:hypothetical protein
MAGHKAATILIKEKTAVRTMANLRQGSSEDKVDGEEHGIVSIPDACATATSTFHHFALPAQGINPHLLYRFSGSLDCPLQRIQESPDAMVCSPNICPLEEFMGRPDLRLDGDHFIHTLGSVRDYCFYTGRGHGVFRIS